MEKCILRERLGEDICNLLSSRDWQYFNDTEADMFSEVMVLDKFNGASDLFGGTERESYREQPNWGR